MTLDRTLPHVEPGVPIRSIRVSVVEGPDQGKSAESAQRLTVGTDPSNHLALGDETVSRHHLELSRIGHRIRMVDHRSTNGTLLAQARVATADLVPGTRLQLGRSVIRVDDGGTTTVELFEGHQLAGLLGQSEAIREMMAKLKRLAPSSSSVLVLGETGTGKEVVATAIHELSPRAEMPLEIVDCGSILPTLLASELFGHERGAFTGADQRHIGAFERADRGTLFLDEVGELPTSVQAALLGALERRAFRRVGGNELIKADVRLVCATNRDLRADVNSGSFRQDLYFRIAVVLLRIPPLRDRIDDLPLLAEHFAREVGYAGTLDALLPEAVMDELKRLPWPGNVRELRNVVEAAIVTGEMPEVSDSASPPGADPIAGLLLARPYSRARALLLDAFEARYVTMLLERAGGNVSAAARDGGLSRSQINRIIRRHDIQPRSNSLR